MSHSGHELWGEATDVSRKGVWLQCDGAPGVEETINADGFAPWLLSICSGKALFYIDGP